MRNYKATVVRGVRTGFIDLPDLVDGCFVENTDDPDEPGVFVLTTNPDTAIEVAGRLNERP